MVRDKIEEGRQSYILETTDLRSLYFVGNGTIYQIMEQRRKKKLVNKTTGSVFDMKLPILLPTTERRPSANFISLKGIEK